jgi:hypothetical protein
VLNTANKELPAAEYAELAGMAAPMNKALERMNRYIGNASEETGGMLGSPGAVILGIVVVGVTLVILASIYATVELYRTRLTARANEMLTARHKSLEESIDREIARVKADSTMSPTEKSERIAELEAERRKQVSKLPVPQAPPESGLPGLGAGLGLAAVAAVGVGAFLFLRRK